MWRSMAVAFPLIRTVPSLQGKSCYKGYKPSQKTASGFLSGSIELLRSGKLVAVRELKESFGLSVWLEYSTEDCAGIALCPRDSG